MQVDHIQQPYMYLYSEIDQSDFEPLSVLGLLKILWHWVPWLYAVGKRVAFSLY